MGGHVIRGLLATYGNQLARMIITLGTTAVLARILMPADFGVFGLAMAFAGVAAIIADMGFSTATSQRPTVDQNLVSILFVLAVGVGLAIAAVLFLAAPAIAAGFGQAAIAPVLQTLSITLVLTALAAQHRALLIRQMRFALLGSIDIIAQAVANGVAIALALTTHWGVWCLVAMQIIWVAISTAALWWLQDWRPSLRLDWRGAQPNMVFGARVTGSTLVIYFGRQVDNILIGFFRSAAELGQYTRAYGIMMLPAGIVGGPLSGVITPALSRLQAQPAQWRNLFLLATGAAAFFATPIALVTGFFAPDIVRIILGPNWALAADLVRILAVAMLIEPLITSTTWALFSQGRVDKMLQATLWSTAAMIIGFGVGVGVGAGARGVALSYSLVMTAMLLPRIAQAARYTPFTVGAYCREIAPQCGGGMFAAAAMALVQITGMIPATPGLWRLCLGGVVISGVYLVGWAALGSVLPGEFRPDRLRRMLATHRPFAAPPSPDAADDR